MASDKKMVSIEEEFEKFSGWHVDNWQNVELQPQLSNEQAQIISQNKVLLLNSEKWADWICAFEEALSRIQDEATREEKRAEYSIHFDRASIPRYLLNLKGYRFPCSVSFNRMQFKITKVSFKGATFGNGQVSFKGATFDGGVLFDDLTLADTSINFEDVEIKNNLLIRNNTFKKCASFKRLSVGGTADFSDSTFHEVPDFTDCKFDRPPDVSGMEVLAFQRKWISPRWKADEEFYGDGLAAKFRKLKAMALAANDHEKDGEFFAYEMLAKRGYETTKRSALWLNWAYFFFSNFGQSYRRPAVALGLNFFIFFVINAVKAAPFLKPADLSSFAFWQSFKNMIPFLNSLIRFASRPDDFKTTYELAFHQLDVKGAPIEFFINAGLFQSFFGLILLFLLLLGLRNKFRLK